MTTDATFRAWGSAVSANLATVGLIQTADTGQIDWATVTMGGAGVDGYEIWRFNDALQATAPVFMKIGYGNANLTTVPGVYLQVGTGSDGSGGLTGTVTTGNPKVGYTNSGGSVTPKACAMAYNGGSFAFLGFEQTVAPNPQMFMAVSRTDNSSGIYDGSGLQVYYFANASYAVLTTQALNYPAATALTVASEGNYSFVPGSINLTTTQVGVNPQVYAHWASLPGTALIPGMVTVMATDVVANTTFSVAIAGATARTYLRLDANWYGAVAPASTNTALAMIWE
jgi:hypothetical protein